MVAYTDITPFSSLTSNRENVLLYTAYLFPDVVNTILSTTNAPSSTSFLTLL